MSTTNHSKKIKAIGLMSGGLDSILAAKVVSDLGIEVIGLTFILPWKSFDVPKAIVNAEMIGIQIDSIQLDEDFLNIVKNPKHGHGTAINPCIDCKIYMLKKAEEYRKKVNADFLFTGEVLGQRPMSQNSNSLKLIERRTGLINQIVRPLSAQMLEPTEAEQKGLINRELLLDLTGRSRKGQIALAEKFNITEYSQPAGGCHLTEKSFERRLRDYFAYSNQNYKEMENLMYGRHYRISKKYKAVLGRDNVENDRLLESANPNDYAFIVAETDKVGPLCLLKGVDPAEEILNICGGLIKRYSKYKNDAVLKIQYWQIKADKNFQVFDAESLSDDFIKGIEI